MELMTIEDIAKLLKVSKRTAYTFTNNHDFPEPVKLKGLSRTVRYLRHEVEKYIYPNIR